ncbi:prefoldin subunit beta [Candidatus Pacearchaeota archaeon]|nr:prefoldin subunit beta [Candidatus Pacearchaeota archaeon]
MQEIDEATTRQIQELQILEQNLQNLSLQRQAFQVEQNETENAIAELGKAKEDPYKIIGQVMIKTNKADLEKDLKHKKEVIGLRIKSIEKQEDSIREHVTKLRETITEKIR